jgi:ABC-type phosphate transport system substrate-binding protein
MRPIRVLYFALVLLAAPFCMARDLAIVVNKSNTTSSVTAAELEKLLKTAVQNWPDGKRVKVFLTDPGFDNSGLSNASQGSAESKMILQRAYKMKPEEIKSLVDAHKADIQVVGSDEIVLTMVDNNPGAIGIVSVYSINSHVKVLKVDEKLPMEPGYLLHGN